LNILPGAVWSGHEPVYIQPIRWNQISAKWGTSSWRKEPLRHNVKNLSQCCPSRWFFLNNLSHLAQFGCTMFRVVYGVEVLYLSDYLTRRLQINPPCTCNFLVNEDCPATCHYIPSLSEVPFVCIIFFLDRPFKLYYERGAFMLILTL
jgi:hypothetical protein